MTEGQLEFLENQRKFIHDIATPISIIQGMVDIILTQLKEENKVDPKVLEKLQKVLAASLKMNSLVNSNREYLAGKSSGV